jgi:hypothetical protein
MPINLSGSLVLTGSLAVTGEITMSGSIASASYALSSSYAANADLLDNRDSSTFANTGSNTFDGGQYLSSSFNPTGFSTTASLYTDGGLRVTKDAYISGTLYLNNVTVYGTQSVCYITSSQLNIASNLITVNTATPSVQFGGLAVYDSGSTGLTGSILWDSTNNHWIYSNPSGSSYSGGMFISGPRTSTLGSETGTTSCMLLAGQGGDHLTSSMIYHSSTVTCFHGNSTITSAGAACFASSIDAGSYIRNTNSGADAAVTIAADGVSHYISATNAARTAYRNLLLNPYGCNVGIGTTVPLAKATVRGGNLGNTISMASTVLSVQANDQGIFMGSFNGTPNFGSWIQAGREAFDIPFDLALQPNGGNIGIGTSSPGRLLEVYSCSTDRGGFIRSSNCGTAGITSSYFEMFIGGCAMSIPTWRNAGIIEAVTTCGIVLSAFCNNIAFQVGNRSEVMRITNAGNVLLACSTDFNKGAKLQITQNASNTNAIDFKNSDATYSHIGTFANNMYLTQNYYYAGGQNNDCSGYGQTAITMGVSTTSGDSYIDFAMSDPGATSPSGKMRLNSAGTLLIGTLICTSEANLILGAKSTIEGGQLILQKGTSCACATHLDNFNDSFRIMSGTNTGSTAVNMSINHVNGIATFSSTICAPLITSAANNISITGTQFLTTLATDNALYIITAQPEAGSGTSAAALITSRTNQNPSVQTIVSSSSLSFVTSGYNLCLCSNLAYGMSARWGIIRLA